jgi:hypothetical protein
LCNIRDRDPVILRSSFPVVLANSDLDRWFRFAKLPGNRTPVSDKEEAVDATSAPGYPSSRCPQQDRVGTVLKELLDLRVRQDKKRANRIGLGQGRKLSREHGEG